ncbi:prolyl 3-hydroxylase OGFOD1-like [Sycon ciliatum]|uniref:prolyl 3-hydroxylase OGFOD1-like n=1 Tax=Sycon ciliatum TaxID=27933 RepID=UPI0031F6C6B9
MSKSKSGSDGSSAPLAKKKRRAGRAVEMNDAFLEETLLSSMKKSIRKRKSLSNDNAKVFSSPFICCSLRDFVTDKGTFIKDLRKEVEDLPFVAKINDLYSFQQTDDIRNCPGPCLEAFRKLLGTKVLNFLRQVTGIELSDRVDATCSKYEDGDTLLCHDDELEGRRIAFIYYLVPEWTDTDGGCLDLFSVDEHGQPDQIVESIVPQPNMFNFFPVTLDSFHQVAEVRSASRTRLSISGWFYGEPFHRPSPYMEPEPPLSGPLTGVTIQDWVNKVYFKPAVQRKIRKRFEKHSEAQLHAFLKPEKYDEVSRALEAAGTPWKWQGPANKRHFQSLATSSIPLVKECAEILASEEMFSLLAKLTGMNLAEDKSIEDAPLPDAANGAGNVAASSSACANGDDSEDEMLMCADDGDEEDEDDDNSDEEDDDDISDDDEDNASEDAPLGKPTSQVSVRHWSPGCYTLMHDLENQPRSMALDAQLFFKAEEWEPNCGGFTCYVAKGEDEELLSIQPMTNSLALVCRDNETMRFIKYLNHLTPTPEDQQEEDDADEDAPDNTTGSSQTPKKGCSFFDIAVTYLE